MPISSEIVGRIGESVTQTIDSRWTMAYAACLGDLAPAYLDTRVRPDVLAHPLFPVCYEWPLFLDPRCMPNDLPGEERVRGVHFTHDVTLHRPIRAGLELSRSRRDVRALINLHGSIRSIQLAKWCRRPGMACCCGV